MRERRAYGSVRGVPGDRHPYRNSAQGHENYSSGQRPIVHLISSIRVVLATGRPWFFTDRHADLGYASQFDTLDRLDEIDWSVMSLKNWSDPEVKERRQAEFLVHDWCPWAAIEVIGVMDRALMEQVGTVLTTAPHQPRIETQRDWYY
jgi:hypothetical protein